MKSANEIRQEFIEFFINKGHTRIPSAPVVPHDDPSLLFTNAGMNQFKDIFLGNGKRNYTRATNSQKCIRAGGKHNDLDEVGKDSYHHSFFEMLGNWSFGDYYKKEAIEWAWELLTDVWKLPKEKLHTTVYTTDDEAFKLWETVTDIDNSRITRHGDKDNFWSMGDIGPCGPSSEIHYDLGEKYCNMKDVPGHVCAVNGDCDRIIEIWNLVFIQYNRKKDGTLEDLPAKHVDTGMGFERICQLLQHQDSNYHIDIFKDIISEIEKISSVKYSPDENGIPHRVIADHARALLFSISDGGMPSNEGRGYVMRRILRRASRFGTKIGLTEPYLYKIAEKVAEVMGDEFPEIRKHLKHAQNIIKAEETAFLKTLSKGMELFNKIVNDIKKEGNNIIDGEVVFKLYDTFGFPADLTEQMAGEIDFTIDSKGFTVAMNRQKNQSRSKQKFKTSDQTEWIVLNDAVATEFIGYSDLSCSSEIIKYSHDEKYFKIVPASSCLYAESGGQVADKGYIELNNVKLDVIDVQKDGEYFVIKTKFNPSIAIDKDTQLTMTVEQVLRNNCRTNHSAAHLLQSAIKQVLGDHIAQSGSYVDEKGFRFDYSHYDKLTEKELSDIEIIVNGHIQDNSTVTTDVIPIEDAKKQNITALFGEKYGNMVRVVKMGDASAELCGGTHAGRTGDIGYFKILSESSIAAGIRRIEAVTGKTAVEKSLAQRSIVEALKDTLSVKEHQILERIDKLSEGKKELERSINDLNEQVALSQVSELIGKKISIGGINVISSLVKVNDNRVLKILAENIRSSMSMTIILLGADIGGKAALVCAVTDDLKSTIKAGQIIGQVAKMVGGGGGGAPHLATAGGKDVSKLKEAIESVKDIIS
ncbi:MAG: alanine--tRNA ligase [Candidatus Delongbacteria bacterium]|jgi:alanyl-tRNA synthetase|nr:alanine--tRNA ligase [Candidatus Delongbacteria bacterium]